MLRLKELLLPSTAGVAVLSVAMEIEVVRVDAQCTAAGTTCPECGAWSTRFHGSYLRFPADVPSAGRSFILQLQLQLQFLLQLQLLLQLRVRRFRWHDTPRSHVHLKAGHSHRSVQRQLGMTYRRDQQLLGGPPTASTPLCQSLPLRSAHDS